MIRSFLTVLPLTLLSLLASTVASGDAAPSVLQLSDVSHAIPITSAMVFEDSNHAVDWESVFSQDRKTLIPWTPTSRFNYGYTPSRYWFKFPVKNLTSSNDHWFLEFGYALLQKIRIYVQDDSGKVTTYSSGRFIPVEDRPIEYRTFLFPFELATNANATIYISVETGGSLRANFRILSEKSVVSATNRQSLGLGIYYGIIAGLVFYNLFLFFALGDANYLYYVLYASSFCALQAALTGHAYQYLWANNGYWSRISVPFLVGFSFFFLALFTRSSLDTKTLAPKSDKLLWLLGAFSLVLILVSLGDYGILPNKLASMMVSYAPLLVVPSIFGCIWAGSKPARYYSVAFIFFFIGSFAVAMKDLGLAPVNLFTLYGMQFGSAIEAVFFSITLAYRVRLFQEEKLLSKLEIASANQELAESRLQLNNERALSAFASEVAHDIRSPLSALDEVLVDATMLPADKRVLARSAIMRIKDVANNLLEKYRFVESKDVEPLELGSAIIKVETHFVSSLLDSVISEKQLQYRNSLNIELRYIAKPNSYGVFAAMNLPEMKRVLSNLVNNAVEALVENRGVVHLELELEGDFVAIEVIDNGRGIPAHRIGGLGRSRQSFGKQGTESGTGLGLYHAREALEKMNGRLEFLSENGKGTTVRVLLSRALAPKWFIERLTVQPNSNVVVVDGDISMHQIWDGRFLAANFEKHSVCVSHCSTLADLETWARDKSPGDLKNTIFLVDYEFQTGAQSGLDAVEALKLESKSILVTGRYDEVEIVERAEQLGVRIIPRGMAGLVPIEVKVNVTKPQTQEVVGKEPPLEI